MWETSVPREVQREGEREEQGSVNAAGRRRGGRERRQRQQHGRHFVQLCQIHITSNLLNHPQPQLTQDKNSSGGHSKMAGSYARYLPAVSQDILPVPSPLCECALPLVPHAPPAPQRSGPAHSWPGLLRSQGEQWLGHPPHCPPPRRKLCRRLHGGAWDCQFPCKVYSVYWVLPWMEHGDINFHLNTQIYGFIQGSNCGNCFCRLRFIMFLSLEGY